MSDGIIDNRTHTLLGEAARGFSGMSGAAGGDFKTLHYVD